MVVLEYTCTGRGAMWVVAAAVEGEAMGSDDFSLPDPVDAVPVGS